MMNYSREQLTTLNKELDSAIAAFDKPRMEALSTQLLAMAKENGEPAMLTKALAQRGKALRHLFQITESLSYYNKALLGYKKLNDKVGQSTCLAAIGWLYFMQGHYKKTKAFAEKAIELSTQAGDNNSLRGALQYLSSAEGRLGNYARSIQIGKQVLDMHIKAGDGVSEAAVCQNMGDCFRQMNDYENALVYVQRALRLFEQYNRPVPTAACWNNMGLVYSALDNHTQAIECHRQSFAIKQKVGDMEGLTYSYLNIARCYHMLNQNEEALEQLSLSLQVAVTLQNTNLQLSAHNGFVGLYTYLKEFDKAEQHAQKVWQLAQATQDIFHIAQAQVVMGELQLRMGNYKLAEEHLQAALTIIKQKEIWSQAEAVERLLHETAEAQGNATQALHHYKEQMRYSQQRLHAEKEQRLLLLQWQFETEQKESEIVRLKAAIQALQTPQEPTNTTYRLSPREKQILALMVDGLSYKMIAAKCAISYETTRTHINRIYKKLAVTTMSEAVAKAVKEGLV